MKVKIEHIPNTYNYGSLMMAVNSLYRLNKKVEGLEFYVDTQTDEDFERLKKETGIDNLKAIAKENRNTIPRKKMIKRLKNIKKEQELYDIKIILGGDDISEYYKKKGWKYDFPIMYAEADKIPTVLLGQSIGPFTSYRKLLAKLTLNKTKIYVRDNHCLDYLEKLGVTTASKGRDLAFLDLPMQHKAKWILDKYNLKNNEYLVIVTSGLTNSYTRNLDEYITEQVNIVNQTLSNDRLKDKKVVLLPHVVKPSIADDRKIIREVIKKINVEFKDRVIAIDDEMLASEAREILSNGLFTITGRMHAAVSTFFMRKPAISLSYSVKYAGVIGDGLDMNDLIIESANEEAWRNKKISKLVNEKVEYVLDNYEELVKRINIKVNENSNIAENQLNDLVKFIKEIN